MASLSINCTLVAALAVTAGLAVKPSAAADARVFTSGAPAHIEARPCPRVHRSDRPLESLPIHVGVTIDQYRYDRLTLEIENTCPWRDVRRHGRIRANGQNPFPGNCDSLGNRELGINLDDLGVLENQVGGSSN